MLSYLGVYTLYTDEPPGPQGSAHASIPTYRSFLGGDGQRLVITANTERMWRELCAVLEREELVEDGRYRTAGDRLANATSLWPTLEAAFLQRPAHEWVKRCIERGVPAALVTDVPEALEAARRDSRSMILTLQNGSGQRTDVIGNPVKIVGRDADPASYPPRLGEHTDEVLGDTLDLADRQIQQLRAAGAVR
jgi:CoA:oxalate CoA-transferase